jgi:Mrp family chromosome partitioning ATPase
MGTQTETLRAALELDAFEPQAAAKESFTEQRRAPWDPNRFAEQQIRWLVRQVFFPQERDAPRQVVFSPVQNNDIGAICLQVGQILSDQVSGSTCVVEADAHARDLQSVLINNGRQPGVGQKTFPPLRNSSQKISEQLWRVPLKTFLGDQQNDLSSPWLRERLAELRLEFDYTVIQAPAARYSEAALLGQLSDGMILVLQANSTRRAAAKKVKQMLLATNVRLLGAVLSERTFPIPQKLYRKL